MGPPVDARAATVAMVRFHAGSGARLAIRAGVPLAAAAVVAVGMAQDPAAALLALAAHAADSRAGPALPLAFGAVLLALAGWGARRLRPGVRGWARHLPASARSHRAGLVLGLVACQAPGLVAWFALWGLAAATGATVDGLRPVVAVALAFAAAVAVLPSRTRTWNLATALASWGVVAWLDGHPGLPLAAGSIVAVWMRTPFETPRGSDSARTRRRVSTRSVGRSWFSWVVAVRATVDRWPGLWLVAAVPVVAAAAFVRNNPGVDGTGPARFAGGLAVATVAAGLAEALAVRRPPWGWARALPWTPRRRVLDDVVLIAAVAAPAPLAIAWVLPAAAVPVAVLALLLGVVAAWSLRAPAPGHGGAWGPVLAVGGVASATLGVSVASLVPLAVLLLFFPGAVERERAARPSRWDPARDEIAGDPRSWSGG